MRFTVSSTTVALTNSKHVVGVIRPAGMGKLIHATVTADCKRQADAGVMRRAVNFFDCCEDKYQACGGCQIPGEPGCVGFCGRQSPGGCWCDEACCGFSDCCADKFAACGGCWPGGKAIPADITGDGIVNFGDLLAVINAWGACPVPPAPCPGDIAPPNGDGTVNVLDLLSVINNWHP